MSRRKKDKNRYRSKFEERIALQLKSRNVKFKYESEKIPYIVPEAVHHYVPDFELPNGIFVEAKGVLDASTRKKMMLVKQQNPEKDIRFVFMRDQPIRKGSETTYSMWAEKQGYKYAVKEIPLSWMKE